MKGRKGETGSKGLYGGMEVRRYGGKAKAMAKRVDLATERLGERTKSEVKNAAPVKAMFRYHGAEDAVKRE